MAKKKVNRKLLYVLIVTGVMVVGLGTAYVIMKLPKDPDMLRARALVHIEAGEWHEATHEFYRAVSHSSKEPERHIELRMEFAALLDERLASDPDLNEELRRSLRATRRAQFEAIINVNPRHEQAQRQLTEQAWEQGRGGGGWEPFLDQSRRMLAITPQDAELHFRRGQTHGLLGQMQPDHIELAMQEFARAVELAPEVPDYWLGWAEYLIRRGELAAGEAKYLEAIEAIDSAVTLRTSYAAFLHNQRRPAEARVQAEIAEGLPNKSSDDYMAMADYHLMSVPNELPELVKIPDATRAMAALESARKADPTAATAYYQLAMLNSLLGEVDYARELVREGLDNLETLRAGREIPDMALDARMRYIHGRQALEVQLANLLVMRLPPDEQERETILAEVEERAAWVEQYNPNNPNLYKIRGQLALVRGDFVEASAQLRQAHEAFNAQEPHTAYMLASLYLRRNQLGEASRLLEQLTGLFPHRPEFRIQRAQLQMAFGNLEDAGRILQELQRFDAQAGARLLDDNQRQVVGDMLARLQQPAGGLAPVVELPSEITEADIQRLTLQAVTQAVQGNLDHAGRIYAAIHQQHPGHMPTISRLVQLYTLQDRRDLASAVLDDAIALYPDDPRLALQKRVVDAPDDATRDGLILEHLNSLEAGAEKEMNLAGFFRLRGQADQYRAHLEAAHALAPQTPGIVQELFRLYISQELFADAERMAAVAKEHNMDGYQGQVFQARIHLARRQWDDAIAVLGRVLREDWVFSLGHAMMGQAHLAKNDIGLAEQSFIQAQEQDPTNGDAIMGLARVREVQGRMDEHAELIRRAYQFIPTNAYVRNRYMEILDAQGDLQESIARRERLAAENQRAAEQGQAELDSANLVRLAELYLRVRPQQADKAVAVYQYLYEHFSGREEALGALLPLLELLGQTQRVDEGMAMLDQAAQTERDKVGVAVLRANFVFNTGQAQQARRLLEEAIRQYPDDARPHEAMAHHAEVAGRLDDALVAMKRVAELMPESAQVVYKLAVLEIQTGQSAQARQRLGTLLQNNPQDIQAISLMGVALATEGDVDAARARFDRVIELDPRNAEARVQRANLSRMANDLSQALADLTEAYRIRRDSTIARQLAMVHSLRGDAQRGKQVLADLLQERPNDLGIVQDLMGLYLQTSDWPALEGLLSRLQQQMPEEAEWHRLEAQMWSRRGQAGRAADAMTQWFALRAQDSVHVLEYLESLVEAGRHAQAMEAAGPFVDHPQMGAVVRALLGRAQIASGQEDEGLASLRQAFLESQGLQPAAVAGQLRKALGSPRDIQVMEQWIQEGSDWRLLLGKGLLHAQAAEWPQALADLGQAEGLIQEPPVRAQVLRQIGTAQHTLSNYPAARDAYVRAIEIDGTDVVSLNNLAYMLAADLNDPAAGLEYARRAVALRPGDANIADTLGWVYYLKGDLEAARDMLIRSTSLRAFPTNIYHLGRVLEKLDRTGEARRQYERAWEMVKDNPEDPIHTQLQEALRRVAL